MPLLCIVLKSERRSSMECFGPDRIASGSRNTHISNSGSNESALGSRALLAKQTFPPPTTEPPMARATTLPPKGSDGLDRPALAHWALVCLITLVTGVGVARRLYAAFAYGGHLTAGSIGPETNNWDRELRSWFGASECECGVERRTCLSLSFVAPNADSTNVRQCHPSFNSGPP